MITSDQNRSVRFIIGLKKKKNREENSCFFIEGFKAVEEAIASSASIKQIVASENFMSSDAYTEIQNIYCSTYQQNVEHVLLPVNDSIFNKMSETETPQGIGAIVEIILSSYENLIEKSKNIVLLENIQDPGNMGTIIRTADAAGFDGIIYTKGCVDIFNSKVLRSTVGSVFHVPFTICPDIEETVSSLKDCNFTIYGAHPRGGICYFDENFTQKNVIVIGNEGNGISDELLGICDKLLTIPMPGKSESLNASVAAALMMYEVAKKQIIH